MLQNGERMYAYAFEGYWKDVGTLYSLWEANMDILNSSDLELYDADWKIYSRNMSLPPQYIGPEADIQDSLVSDGCSVNGSIHSSIIYSGVTIENNVVIDHSVVMPGAVIKSGAVVKYAIIGADSVIESDVKIGASKEETGENQKWDIAVIGHGEVISSGVSVAPGQMIPTV